MKEGNVMKIAIGDGISGVASAIRKGMSRLDPGCQYQLIHILNNLFANSRNSRVKYLLIGQMQ
jgi:hypothetical protein